MAFEVGQRVGDYEIVQLLGVGGMGHVYRVRNVISDRTEAMKVLLPDLTAERDLAIRFISEIRTLASFDHPNIALLHTAFMANNQLVMVMEFVEGSTLEDRAKQSPMTIAEVCGYVYQALGALSYAHGRDVVHRDIKPANLMLTSHGIIKLMDFGIAKSKVEQQHLTQPGTTIGSLYYMSPEQVRGDAVDARSDLYSVGIMLYELLAGRKPFEADTTFSILNQQLNAAPQPPIELNPQIPRALNDVILHALAKRPEDRYQTADAFRNALRPFCPNQSVEPGQIAIAPSPAVMNTAPGAAAQALSAVEAASATSTVGAPPPPPVTAAPPPSAGGFQPVNVPPQVFGAPAQSAPAMVTPTRQGGGNKGLWIATGIAAAILAMVGLAFALPHFMGTHASTGDTAPQTQQPQPAPQAVDTPAATPAQDIPPATGGENTAAPAPMPTNNSAGTMNQAGPRNAPRSTRPMGGIAGGNFSVDTGAAAPITRPGSSTELAEARDRYSDLTARASAVDGSLNTLRQQQEASGLGLRHDMAAADSRLQSSLASADEALRSGDAAASRSLARAEQDLTVLEHFLGH